MQGITRKNSSTHGQLERAYVHKDFQGIGIASALIYELEQRAKKIGITRFETYASITAKPFFEKKGYAVVRENRVIRNDISLINYKMVKHS